MKVHSINSEDRTEAGFGRLKDCLWEQLEQEQGQMWHRRHCAQPLEWGQVVPRLVSRHTLGKANDLVFQILPGEP